jgi:hypothetical protein
MIALVSSSVTNGEDCLDRADDRYAHEYYSDSYDSHKERRRHNNDTCNAPYTEKRETSERELERARLEERQREEKATADNIANAKKLLKLMNQ